MSTTEARVQAAPAVQTSEILGSTQEYQQYSTRKYYEYSLYTLPKFCQHSKYSSCPSVNIFSIQVGMELSNGCTNGRIILHTPEYTANIPSIPSIAAPTDEMRPVRAVQYPQYRILNHLKYRECPQYRTPKYCVPRSIRCTE